MRDNNKFPTDQIGFDNEVFPRDEEDGRLILRYMEAMQAGAKFPPIVIAEIERHVVVVDGWHRLKAARRIGNKTISVVDMGRVSKEKAYEESVRRNISNGKALSWHERMNAAHKFIAQGMSYKRIESILQIPAEKVKPYLASRIAYSSTGQEVVLKSAIKHLAGESVDEIGEQDILVTSNVITIVEQLIRVIENKWLDLKDEKLLERLRHLANLCDGVIRK